MTKPDENDVPDDPFEFAEAFVREFAPKWASKVADCHVPGNTMASADCVTLAKSIVAAGALVAAAIAEHSKEITKAAAKIERAIKKGAT